MKKLLPLLLSSTLFASHAFAAEEPEEISKEGIDYFALINKQFDFRSLGTARKGTHWASELVAGTYITNYVTVEGRLGGGWDNSKIEDFDLVSKETVEGRGKIKYWASWYMGVNYPLTEFLEVYFKYGFSHVMGEANFAPGVSPERYSDEFLTSTFSVSWIGGADIELTENTYLTLEVGRLHADTTTNIKTFHAGAGLKYQY